MKFWGKGLFALLVLVLLVACGDDTGSSGDGPDTPLSEKRSLSGLALKGPFLKGATVSVQEMDSDYFLPVGAESVGKVENDSGRYFVEFGEFASPFVLLKASGYFRDELTGEQSKSPISLYALTNISERDSANVNLLTHLAYKRALYLSVKENLTLEKAKRQAEREVLALFYIKGDFASAEDLSIFGSDDGNAALLAMSILVSGALEEEDAGSFTLKNPKSGNEDSKLSRRISDIAADIEKDGEWNDARTIVKIADWAEKQSQEGGLDSIRKTLTAWKLSKIIPAFEKYVNNFWWKVYGLDACNAKLEGNTYWNMITYSKNEGYGYVCSDGKWLSERMLFGNPDSTDVTDTTETADTTQVKDTTQVTDTTGVADTTAVADTSAVDTVELSELEKDTQGQKCLSFGQIVHGAVDTNKVYFCDGTAWKLFEGKEDAKYYKLVDSRDGRIYRYVRIGTQEWMAENLNYGGVTAYTWTEAKDACPVGWHLSTREEWEKTFSDINGVSASALDGYGFATIPSGQLKATYWTDSFEKDAQGKRPYSVEFSWANTGLSSMNAATTRLPVRCVKDYDVFLTCNADNLYSTAIHNYVIYLVCLEDGWDLMSIDDYNEFKWTVGVEGKRMWDGTNPRRCYVYESGAWHERDSSNCRLSFGACTAARDGELVTANGGGTYVCENFAWRRLSHVEVEVMGMETETAEEGDVISTGCVLEHIYVFQDGKWRLGTKMDSILVSLGGTACLHVGDTSKVKYDGKYYKCMENVYSDVPQEWVAMPDLYNETHDDIDECSETGLYGDGTLHDKSNQANHIYVCDKGDFRRASNAEKFLGLGCVSYNRGKKLKANLSQFVCAADGWDVDRSVGNGVLVDPRDGKEYRTVSIWKQTWMAENMNYTDSTELSVLSGHAWCYGNDAGKCDVYGALYGCAAAREVCPDGWHLPTMADWDSLLVFTQNINMYRGISLRSVAGWINGKGEESNGEDRFGFTILPGGGKYADETFKGELYETWFWYDSGCEDATFRKGVYVNYGGSFFFDGRDEEEVGYYVRCIKDEDPAP